MELYLKYNLLKLQMHFSLKPSEQFQTMNGKPWKIQSEKVISLFIGKKAWAIFSVTANWLLYEWFEWEKLTEILFFSMCDINGREEAVTLWRFNCLEFLGTSTFPVYEWNNLAAKSVW